MKKQTDPAPVLHTLREPVAGPQDYRAQLVLLDTVGPYRLDLAGMAATRKQIAHLLHGAALAISRGAAKGCEDGGSVKGRALCVRWKLERVKG